MEVTRRQFASLVGLLTVGGVSGPAAAAESLIEVLGRRHAGAAKEAPGSTGGPRSPDTHSAKVPGGGHTTVSGGHKALITPEEIWADLMQGNKRFVAGKPHCAGVVRTREGLVKGQHPQVIVLGCADSRVSPELLFDKSLGDLFIVRTAGNIADPIALGSLEYAAEHLHAKVLVVLGHENCGAVAAAAAGGKMPTRNLDAIVKKIAPALEPLKGKAKGDELVRLGVEADVHQSAKDVVAASSILQQEIADRKLALIKALYRLQSGEVVRLT